MSGCRKHEFAGILLYVLASLLLSLMFFSPRLAGVDAHPIVISFVRYLGGVPFVLLLFFIQRTASGETSSTREALPQLAWVLHFARALIGIGQLSLTVLAASLIPVAAVQSILAAHGAVVLMLIVVFDKRKIAQGMLLPTLACILGAIIAASPAAESAFSREGLLAAAGASLLSAIEVYIFRRAAQFGSAVRFLLPINIFGAIVLAVPAFIFWTPLDSSHMLVLLAMGPMAVLAQLLSVQALRWARLDVVVPFRYSSVPFAVIIGLLLAQVPTPSALLGSALVVISGIAVSRRLAQGQD